MAEENIFNTEERVRKFNEAQKRQHQKEINDIRKVLKNPEGRRFIWRIWSMAGLFCEPFALNSNQTAFNLGRMSLGRDLLADVNEADSTAFAKLQNEYVSALQSKKEAKENG